jgi:nucleoside-diphosphate-sugar epimerase
MGTIIAADIARLLDRTPSLWEPLRAASLFISGGTGFFGTWLLETLVAANRRFSLDCRATVLTRDPVRFATKAPHLATDPAVSLLAGDVRDFSSPTGPVTHVIHAATEASATLNADQPNEMFDVCVAGTRRMLALAQEKRARRFLFASSGAVYGRQPPELARVPEDFTGGPDPLDPRSAYAEGKRGAEFLCALAARPAASGGDGLHVSIARGFAFVGPHLPLDVHFAIGNFLRDVLAGGPIRIGGDGTPFRSYLYAADLAEWLFTILLRGEAGRAYNVGSEEAVSIRELADRVADVAARLWPDRGRPEIVMAKQPVPGKTAERYVPDCRRARVELGLASSTSLDQAIRLTMLAACG